MRRLLVTAAMLIALTAPAAAHAATATTADGNLHYTAAAGEINNVSFSRVSGESFRVTDVGATIIAGAGCIQESPNMVRCTTAVGHPIIANLGDQNDSAASRTSRVVQLFGEDGNDHLAGGGGRDILDGGPGDDVLSGGAARDTMSGSTGNDQLFGQLGNDNLHGEDGNDLLDGGSGSDSESGGNGDDTLRQGNAPNGADLLFGDSGNDTVDYGFRLAPVNVTVDGVANDGDRRSNERDNVRTSVERVIGGAASDILIGRDGFADTLVGGAGDDVIDPRRGNDHVDGGPGIDQIRLRDLDRDDVTCGVGTDSVAADRRDIAAADCEKVRRTAAMSLALARRAAYPTVMLRLTCPASAFKSCRGRVVIRTLSKVRTDSGRRVLTVGVRRFTVGAGSTQVIGVRIRGSAKRFLGRRGRVVRAALSAFDGAGPARKDPIRFRLHR
jgi:RTX calcium-binding nonapeptide repeat (4 copies)